MSQFYCVNEKNVVNLDLVCNIEFTENSCELFFVNGTSRSFKGNEMKKIESLIALKKYWGKG